MTHLEIIDLLAEEYISYYLWSERSDNPCEFYNYKVPCTHNCKSCFVSWLEKQDYEEVKK